MTKRFNLVYLTATIIFLLAVLVLADNPFPGGCVGGKPYSERISTFNRVSFKLKSVTRNGKIIGDSTVNIKLYMNNSAPLSDFKSLTTANIFPDTSLGAIKSFQLVDTVNFRVNLQFFKNEK